MSKPNEQGSAAPAADPGQTPGGAGFLDNVALPPDPPYDEKWGAGADEAQAATAEGTVKEGTETPAEGEAKTDDPAKPEEAVVKPDATAKEHPDLPDQYKKVKHLAAAYEESSKEGRRQKEIAEGRSRQLATLQQKLDDAILEKELGAFKELTEEQIEALTPREQARYEVQKDRYENTKKELVKRQKDREAAIEAHIDNEIRRMTKDTKGHPDFTSDEIQALMDQLVDEAQELEGSGYTWAPSYTYFAAYGLRAIKAQQHGKTATDAATKKVAEKAAADAKAAGSPGGPVITAPASNGKGLDDVNARILRASQRRVFT